MSSSEVRSQLAERTEALNVENYDVGGRGVRGDEAGIQLLFQLPTIHCDDEVGII